MIDKEGFSRLMDEFRDLTVKMVNLVNFLNDPEKMSKVGPTNQALLAAQYGAMMAYSKTLELRISYLKVEMEQNGIDISDIIENKTQHPELDAAVEEAEKKVIKKTTRKKSTKKTE